MDLRFFPAVIVAVGDGTFGAVFPDFPDCMVAAATVDEAAFQAVAVLREHLAWMTMTRVGVPTPSPFDVPLPDWIEHDAVVARVMVPA